MCNVGTSQILESLRTAAVDGLEVLREVPELSQEALQMTDLLESSAPIIAPLPEPVPGQLTSRTFVQCEFRHYPSLLEELAGPPMGLGGDPLLGLVTAECALAALRRGEVQAALSALFISTLCASRLEDPASEALHHLLLECAPDGSVGLFELGGRRSGTSPDQMLLLRHRHGLRFVATAVQIVATFGGPLQR